MPYIFGVIGKLYEECTENTARIFSNWNQKRNSIKRECDQSFKLGAVYD